MRYADGGGMTAQGRSRREQVRLQAAGMFEQDAEAGPPLQPPVPDARRQPAAARRE